MSVLDRMHKREASQRALTAAGSTTVQPSSTPEARSPVVLRLQAVMSTLNNFVISNDDGNLAKFAFLFQAVTDEVIEELTSKDDDTLGLYMEKMGEVIAWIGHGDDTRLPEVFKPFAEQKELANQEA